MKVEKINQNYSALRLQSNNSRAAQTPYFTGNLKNEITELLPNKTAIKVMEKLKWLKGEIGGILITALGTGAVAPIFIAYNPFVKAPEGATEKQKEDVENTKKYTAMRQPVSAVLAVIFQTSILKPIDKGLEILFNNPKYAQNLWVNLDQSTLNKKSYMEKIVKKEMKAEGREFKNKQEFETELNKRVEARLNEQINKTAEAFGTTRKITIGSRTVDNQTIAEIINKSIDNYIDDANNLKINDAGLDFYKRRATILIKNEEIFEKLFNNNNLPNNGKEIADYLKQKNLEIKDPDVKLILEEIINAPENLRASRCNRTLERIKKIKKACEGTFTEEKYLQTMIDTNNDLSNIVEQLKKCKIDKVENATEKTIQEAIQQIAECCQYEPENQRLATKVQSTATFQSSLGELLKNIRKDIVKGYKKVLEERYKGFNQISKIAIGLCITLPITCTALNWVYPRFMKLCFPKLSGCKKEDAASQKTAKNGGDN